jgi:hypothetical protein
MRTSSLKEPEASSQCSIAGRNGPFSSESVLTVNYVNRSPGCGHGDRLAVRRADDNLHRFAAVNGDVTYKGKADAGAGPRSAATVNKFARVGKAIQDACRMADPAAGPQR